MTTSVTIKNNGPYRVNVNEVEVPEGERSTSSRLTTRIR